MIDDPRRIAAKAAALLGGLLLLAATVAWLGPAVVAEHERMLENNAGWGRGPWPSPAFYESRGAPPPR